MTGFGRAEATTATKKFTVELRTLNSKQLDLSIRVPGQWRELEVTLRPMLATGLQRGKAECGVTAENTGTEAGVDFNMPVLASYKEKVEQMRRDLQLPEPADWYATLLRLPEVFHVHMADAEEADAEGEAITRAAKEALANLQDFRKREGAKLEVFFKGAIEGIGALLKQVEPLEKERVPKIKARLEEQLQRLAMPEYDHERLEQEMIFYLEKLDVTEEKTRLRAHLDYFMETMELPEGGQGKKLGFIAQEMGREINTLGSKANHAGIQRIVVQMKDLLEQIKEQVLNVL